ncbi:cytochrome P450 4V2-like [Spodoptera litura]|uniref:Cytochrome P450 4V2-like n=1 Tax=Spodoptera litura TaxID=69820 RepID=A0A9J7E6M9_SPOLT|nr:cytochrome P450 4V2-like [Spodoptera litura]XP_022823176.1 cytochrome P450 4V2-like [Spodoptera litura]
MIILAIIFLATCVLWLYWAAKARRMDQMTASLPALPTLPLIGNGSLFLGDTQQILKNLWTLADLAFKHKNSAKLWLGPKLYVAIGDPEDAQVVLENCLDKDVVYRFLRPWLGHGLFVAPVNLWKAHRKVLLPVFHNKIVEEYLGVIAEQAEVLVERLNERVDAKQFDVLKYITACTLDIVFETAMGERMDVQHSPDTPYLRARHTVMEILNMRLFKVWLQPDCIFNLTPYAKQQRDNIDLTHKFTDEVVQKKRLEYERKKGDLKDQNDGKLRAVLDLLFGREIEFTDEQLREHIDSITIAGNDTTALVIAYTLVLLGIHQDAQERVLQEQESIFGSSTRGSTKEDLQQMHYLERVIKESMRLYTVVPIIARNIDRDIYLPTCGVTVPAGAGAVIGAFAIHQSAAWGPKPEVFDPDRFLPERSQNRHPAAFLPFSYGSRNCIGRNFGMLIMKSIISTVVRSYKIEADEIGPLKVEMLLFPINGHQIKISRRTLLK